MDNSLHQDCINHSKSKINNMLKSMNVSHRYHFINIQPFHLSGFIYPSRFFRHKNVPYVILTEKNLLPLSLFFFNNIGSVVTILKSETPIKEIAKWLKCLDGMKLAHPSVEDSTAMTISDIYLLNLLISGRSVKNIATKLSVSKQTIYSRRVRLASMMGIRKIEQLCMHPASRII